MTAAAPSPAQYRAARIVAGAFAAAFTLYGLWYGANLLPHDGMAGSVTLLPIPLFAFALATICGWFAVCGAHELHRQMILVTVGIGVAVGGVSFLIGFVGPMLWTPASNQGPLLGILITGPLGSTLGCIGGAVLAALVLPARARRGGRVPGDSRE
jgi:hypothetical protein